MKFFVGILLVFRLAMSTYSNPIPEPTLDCIVPLLALGAAAFGVYGGSLGSGFVSQYPNSAGGVYGGPYNGVNYGANPYYYGANPNYYGANPNYYGANPSYYSINPYYGDNSDYDYGFFF